MLREPAELRVDDHGRDEFPVGLLGEAGIAPGADLLAFGDGDGRIVLRRAEDAMRDLLEHGEL
ncbi:hypothetical protein [Streptomyces sp. EMB24]|uniref:hypothetical protein n=1 Tax=Streptomyces sp. EMB24 TaxID=2835531 RepID=UPI00227D1964|nr:hypothetical protein [Streptomyces sp. EMB24]